MLRTSTYLKERVRIKVLIQNKNLRGIVCQNIGIMRTTTIMMIL